MRNRSRLRIQVGYAFAVFSVLFFSIHFVFAQELNSSNFRVERSLINSFGGEATSTSFSTELSGSQTAAGEATSTSFIMDMGFLNFETFFPRSQNWRWYDDETNETPTAALAAENTAPVNVETGDVIKLRVTLKEMSDIGAANAKFSLQYSTTSDFSSGGYLIDEVGDCENGSVWCFADGVDGDDDLITTGLLTDSDACVAGVGDGCGTHNESGTTTSAFTHIESAATEYEFTLEQAGASANTVYFFRLVHVASGSAVPLNTGEMYPSVTTGGTTLEFTIDGLTSGVTTEGVTTDVTTTATAIPFGTLSTGLPTEAAQRMTVTTNATSGYKIYAYQRQALVNAYSAEIDPVSGTNASPSDWSSGCSVVAAGCYGYHSGEDVLEGGSTRFTANDTFAQFTGSAEEVAHGSGPTEDEVVDMVYRVEVRTPQEDGNYESAIVYIVVPLF